MLSVTKAYYILKYSLGEKNLISVFMHFIFHFHSCIFYSLIFENNINPENKPHLEWWDFLETENNRF